MEPSKAIEYAGGINALARILGVSRQLVQHYRRTGHFPANRLEQLKQARPEWFKREKT